MTRVPAFLVLVLAIPVYGQVGAARAGHGGSGGSAAGPCQDFYEYTCSAWQAANPIPKNEAIWSRFSEIREHNTAILHDILENARQSSADRSTVNREIGDFYEACMDTAAIEKRGTKGLDAAMAKIAGIDSSKSFLEAIASLHGSGVGAFWSFSSQADTDNSKMMLSDISQSGFSLPDPTYYRKDDEHSKMLRAKLKEHIARMFTLLGDPDRRAAEEADTVFKLETRLAQTALLRQDRIDPAKTTHKLSAEQLRELTPAIDWPAYFGAIQAPPIQTLNVSSLDYLRTVDSVVREGDWNTIRTYLRWNVLNNAASRLPAKFVDLSFDFYGRTLNGVEEMKPRWWRCTFATDGFVGEALGQEFVARAFPPKAKEKMIALVREIEKSMDEDIQEISWMTDPTKAQAMRKLKKLTRKIGYPDHWIDYSSVKIDRDDYLGNVNRLSAFQVARDLAKIGKPVDQSEWDYTPPTVNAYYGPPTNSINFMAGMLQPPLFDVNADDAQNLGGIGIVIGHELTHGYDNHGRQYDADGNLRDWWVAADDRAFKERSQCFVDEYSSFDFAPGVKGNGELTLGENIADNGGMRIAYRTLQRLLAAKPGASEEKDSNGFTPEQRFFMSYGQSWCGNIREKFARNLALSDEHSLPKWRVNGPLENSVEFRQAFGCSVGQPMVRENACRVW